MLDWILATADRVRHGVTTPFESTDESVTLTGLDTRDRAVRVSLLRIGASTGKGSPGDGSTAAINSTAAIQLCSGVPMRVR